LISSCPFTKGSVKVFNEVILKVRVAIKGAKCQEHVEQEWNDPEWSGVTLEWKRVDNKSKEQLWPQLIYCASISCHVCGCIFQED